VAVFKGSSNTLIAFDDSGVFVQILPTGTLMIKGMKGITKIPELINGKIWP